MITLRLNQKLQADIEYAAESLGISKSELIRESVSTYIANLAKPNAWEIGEEVFGKYASGKSNLAKDRKALFKKKVKEKIRAKRA